MRTTFSFQAIRYIFVILKERRKGEIVGRRKIGKGATIATMKKV
jgi:hypothetical protein